MFRLFYFRNYSKFLEVSCFFGSFCAFCVIFKWIIPSVFVGFSEKFETLKYLDAGQVICINFDIETHFHFWLDCWFCIICDCVWVSSFYSYVNTLKWKYYKNFTICYLFCFYTNVFVSFFWWSDFIDAEIGVSAIIDVVYSLDWST